MSAALIPHATLYRPNVGPKVVAYDPIESARKAHAGVMRAALRAVLKAAWRDRRDMTFALSALLETPRDSLAARIIDLAPARERATLREQIL